MLPALVRMNPLVGSRARESQCADSAPHCLIHQGMSHGPTFAARGLPREVRSEPIIQDKLCRAAWGVPQQPAPPTERQDSKERDQKIM